MLLEQIMKEVSALSTEEQMTLLAFLMRQIDEAHKGVHAESLRGILRSMSNLTDEELREDYINYLEEKYR